MSTPPHPGLAAVFPPLGLRITVGDLELRPFADADLPEYAALLRRPIFADESADHVFPWYAVDPDTRVLNALRFQWTLRGAIRPESWTLTFGIRHRGRLIGSQDVVAQHFARRRTVSTGSWLTLDAQGYGLGKLMRQAVLVLAFDHLGALRAETAAVQGNAPSQGVSRACGYRSDGTQVNLDGERVNIHDRFVLTPEDFVRPEETVSVDAFTPALRSLLGVAAA